MSGAVRSMFAVVTRREPAARGPDASALLSALPVPVVLHLLLSCLQAVLVVVVL